MSSVARFQVLWATCLLAAGGCAEPHVRFMNAECQPVAKQARLEAVVFASAFEAQGFAGEQLIYRVNLLNSRYGPVKSRNGRYEDAAGNVAATKALVVQEGPSIVQRIQVTIPAQELELQSQDLPAWAAFGLYRPDGVCVAERLAPLPALRALDSEWPSGPLASGSQATSKPYTDEPAPDGQTPGPAARLADSNGLAADDGSAASAATQPTGAGPAPLDHERRAGALSSEPTWYTVKKGDTLQSIAHEHYGEQRFWVEILTANRDLRTRQLRVGQRIVLPAKDEMLRPDKHTQPGPGASARPREAESRPAGPYYVVREGDSLIGIAHRELHDASRWLEIYELNRDRLRSPDGLTVGMELRLPPTKPEPKGTNG